MTFKDVRKMVLSIEGVEESTQRMRHPLCSMVLLRENECRIFRLRVPFRKTVYWLKKVRPAGSFGARKTPRLRMTMLGASSIDVVLLPVQGRICLDDEALVGDLLELVH